MRVMKLRLTILGALVILVGVTLSLQRQEATQLRGEIALLREQRREFDRLRAENGRLTKTQISKAEVEALRADHAAVVRLRGEIEALKQRAQEVARVPTVRKTTSTAVRPSDPSVMEAIVPISWLKNAGQAAPTATLQTALWAAAGGDIDVLANTLAFEAGSRVKAEQILAGLPETMRVNYATPERLVAFMTVKDVPLGGVRIYDPKIQDQSGTRLVAQLQDAAGKNRIAGFSLRQFGDDWKLVVPVDVVEKYGEQLKNPTLPATAK